MSPWGRLDHARPGAAGAGPSAAGAGPVPRGWAPTSSPLRARGFTLIEMLVTLALVGLLASVALPLYEVTVTRMKEVELRQALRTIRSALDAYKAATDTGQIAKQAGDSGYPATLDLLTEPIEVTLKRNLDGAPIKHVVFLRQLPRDPFYADRETPAAQTWRTRGYATRATDPQPGEDVFDVASQSERTALDGTHYKDW